MKRRYLLFLFALLCSAYSFGFFRGEDDPLKILISKLDQYRNKYPQEKIHIHTDKPYYSIGDSIWFKAYVVNTERNELSALSRIVYVDLINEKDSIKKSLRIPVISGLAWGDFILSDSLSEGNYRLRAYTTWMRNFGDEYYFDKTIQIGNSLSNQLISDVKYSYSKTGIKENVLANISYRDINGKPVSGKEVTYNIQLDHRNIATGKGVTDANGLLQIKFTNSQPFVLKSGKINTTIKLEEKVFIHKVFPVKATSSDIDLQFFPESGELVNGLRSKVAFKALGADGLGKEVSGIVINQNNDTLARIKTEHAGMGLFNLIPQKDQFYTAIIKLDDGSEKRVQLPKAKNEGYVLSVSPTNNDSILVKISASSGLLGTGEVSLLAMHNGVVQLAARNKLTNTAFSTKIPKSRFPTGIIQFTLLSPSYLPVAERLYFVNNGDILNLDVKSNKATYGTREKVTLDIDAKDKAGKGQRSNFSVSVVNETKIPSDELKETTILSNLLLTSDLKGYVEKPNYYFIDTAFNRQQHLDILLLTQGWRRFSWNNVIAGNNPGIVYPVEQTLFVSGRVTTPNGASVAGGKITLLATQGKALVLDTVTDTEGRFRFDSLQFNDSTRFVVQAWNAKGRKNVVIELDQLPPQLVTKNKSPGDLEINVNQSLLTYLKNRRNDFDEMKRSGMLRRSILLEEVKIVQKKPVITNSSNLNGAGNADAIIKADQLQNCISLPQCLQGRVAGLVIQNGIAYLTRSMYSSFSGLVPMQLIIDGSYVEPDYLSIINPNDVESIEILKNGGNTAIYGIRGGGGVLIINTKRGERNLTYRGYSPGIASFTPQGLSYGREFYSPVYRSPQNNRIPDLRNTIFWTPNILTDEAGKSSLSFYTADSPGTYKVVIEGLGFDGTLARKVYRFKVENK